MNANQIADELENIYWVQGDGKGKPFQQYADFVRQQQEQINNLKQWEKRQLDLIETQQAEIEELKTCLIVEQEHNERMVEDRSKYEALAHVGGVEAGKELTDEEIRTIQAICHLKNVGYDNFIMRFARAILRKAQEK